MIFSTRTKMNSKIHTLSIILQVLIQQFSEEKKEIISYLYECILSSSQYVCKNRIYFHSRIEVFK